MISILSRYECVVYMFTEQIVLPNRIFCVVLQYMETIRQTVVENLKQLAHAPSIQMVERVRPWQPETKSKNEGDPDVRETAEEKDQR